MYVPSLQNRLVLGPSNRTTRGYQIFVNLLVLRKVGTKHERDGAVPQHSGVQPSISFLDMHWGETYFRIEGQKTYHVERVCH